MPAAKYYSEEQRYEAKKIQMLEAQIKKRATVLQCSGGKCTSCGEARFAALTITPKGLLCANCNQVHRADEALVRLAERRAALQQCRLASWHEALASGKDEDMENPNNETPTEHTLRVAAELKEIQERRRQEIEAQLNEQQEEDNKLVAEEKQRWLDKENQ